MNHSRSLVWSLISTRNEWTWDRLFSGNIFVKHCLSTWKRDPHAKNTRLQHYGMFHRSQFCNRIHISNLNLRPKQIKCLKGSSNGKDCVAILPKDSKKSMIFHLLPVWMLRKFNSGVSFNSCRSSHGIASPSMITLIKDQTRRIDEEILDTAALNVKDTRQAKGEYRRFGA